MKATVGRIWEAASKDKSRPVLMHVRFDAEQATLTASNSYIMARVPCEVEEGDESGWIPAVAIREAKGRSLRIADGKATLELADGARIWNLLSEDDPARLPNFDRIIADIAEADVRYGINHELLAALGAAVGAGGRTYDPLILHPVHPLKGIRVDAPHGGFGVLMPVRVAQPAASEAA